MTDIHSSTEDMLYYFKDFRNLGMLIIYFIVHAKITFMKEGTHSSFEHFTLMLLFFKGWTYQQENLKLPD